MGFNLDLEDLTFRVPLSFSNLQSRRSTILDQEDSSELHRLLANLPILGAKPIQDLLLEAYRLFKDHPPHKLLALSGLKMIRYSTS